MRPLVTVVVPTRDRPDLVAHALQSLQDQEFDNFEVVVCDNFVKQPCREVFDRHSDARFRYVRPPAQLSMHENWEYAVGQASGEYVTVLIDKTVLKASALRELSSAVDVAPSEIYSWWGEPFYFAQVEANSGPGYLIPTPIVGNLERIATQAEIARRLTYDVRRGEEGRNYYLGKICFGAYSRGLIYRIKARHGVLFAPISPDYTSMAAALAHTESLVDIGRPLLISLITSVSNGMNVARQAGWALKFLRTCDPELRFLKALPVPGVYASVHNTVGYDYRFFARPGESSQAIVQRIDFCNLAIRVREDLDRIECWDSKDDRDRQYAFLESFVAKLPAADQRRYKTRVGRPLVTAASDVIAGHKTARKALKEGVIRALQAYPQLYEQVVRTRRRIREMRHPRFANVNEAARLGANP